MDGLKACFMAAVLVFATGSAAYPFCFEEAGREYGINPQILRAIAKVESNFNPAAVNRNSNGTYDFGLMQINSIWASTLGEERWKAQGDACFNTKTGAWILSMCMKKYGYTWKAIGCYNSQTPEKSERYSRMVFKELQRVKPLAQEAAYAPLKDKLEGLVQERVEGWIAATTQGDEKTREFTEKVQGTPQTRKVTPQEPPQIMDPGLQGPSPQAAAGAPQQSTAQYQFSLASDAAAN